MAGCLILGDSLALGIAVALNASAGHVCDFRARQGASTADIAKMYVAEQSYHLIIVSAGSNDRKNADLLNDLRTLRDRLAGRRVVWIYP
jgi:hypothetical protein